MGMGQCGEKVRAAGTSWIESRLGEQRLCEHVLSHDMPHRTRRWQFACKSAHAHTGSANRFCEGRHPNGENGEIVSPARDADNLFASQRMLAQALPTASAKGGTRMARMGKLSVPHAMLAVSLPAGTCSLMMCPPHTPALYAMRSLSCGARTRLAEQRRLSAPHATLAASFPESKCSPIPCLPRALSFRTAPFSSQVRGDRGRATPEWQNRKTCSFCTRCC